MKKTKKTAALLLILALALSLCACGGSGGDGKSEAPANMESSLPGTAKTGEPEAQAGQTDPLEEIKAKVLALKDHPVSELYEAIGQPQKSDYAPSCLGPGEDGMLYYDGFTVYTYREGDKEVVYDVE